MTNPDFDDNEQPTQPSSDEPRPPHTETVPEQPEGQPEPWRYPPQRMTSKRRGRYRSRLRGCLAAFFVCTLMTLLTCVASLAAYVLFPPPTIDIVVMGLDSRDSEGMATRTDSIIVVGIQPAGLDVSLLSIPRDLFVDVPGYGLQRINTVNMLGEIEQLGSGATLLSQSIQQNFGIGIDKYARLDFQAFIAVVDAVGGVTIDVPSAITDYEYPAPDGGTMQVHFEPGRQHMNGETALIYARTRHTGDDYQRAERQQQVLSALSGKLVNPLNWAAALNALNRYVETDLNIIDMLKVSPTVLLTAGRFDQLVINRDYIVPGDGYSLPDYERLRPWIEARFD